MARLPDPLKRRDILYGKNTPSEALKGYGDLYLQEGRLNDAVEFFGRARYRKGLLHIRQIAVEEGDFFLFSRAMEFLQEEVAPETWRELGRKAMEKGKYLFALKCFEKVSDRERIAEVRERLGEMMKEKEAS